MEIVSKNFIHDCFGFSLEKKLDKHTVYLGDQTILILEYDDFLYCCSLISNKEDDFLVKVDYILIFKNFITRYNQLERIIKIGGL